MSLTSRVASVQELHMPEMEGLGTHLIHNLFKADSYGVQVSASQSSVCRKA